VRLFIIAICIAQNYVEIYSSNHAYIIISNSFNFHFLCRFKIASLYFVVRGSFIRMCSFVYLVLLLVYVLGDFYGSLP
jgi:hypothetical protein